MTQTETATGTATRYRRSVWKNGAFFVFALVFLVLGAAMLASERNLTSLGVFAFGLALTLFFGWQMRLVREDVLILDARGIEDTRPKIFVGWDEIERVGQRWLWIQGGTQRYVNLKIKAEHWPDVSQRWPHRFQRRMARFGGRTVTIQVSLLNARPKRIADHIIEIARARGIPTD